jgi:2-phosphosulfolactate phosphatase
MIKRVEVILSPSVADCYDFTNKTVVVIDIFRATTTIAAAFASGISAVYSTLEIENAQALKSPTCMTAGERNGKKIAGFDLGNSPTELLQLVSPPQSIALTSTNGTKCIELAIERGASTVICGSISNAGAVVDFIKNQTHDVLLFCAGWKNRVNLEDTFFAGLIISECQNLLLSCDASFLALQSYTASETKTIEEYLKSASHYERLLSFGCLEDLNIACSKSIFNVVPTVQSFKNGVAVITC